MSTEQRGPKVVQARIVTLEAEVAAAGRQEATDTAAVERLQRRVAELEAEVARLRAVETAAQSVADEMRAPINDDGMSYACAKVVARLLFGALPPEPRDV